MKFDFNNIRLAIAFLLTSVFFGCNKEDEFIDRPVSSQYDQLFYATAGNVLYTYNTKSVRTPSASIRIDGLESSEQILSIDFRPATGELYALSSSSKIYILNVQTGRVRAVSTVAFTPKLESANARINFDPTTDMIRLITDRGQNLRIDPITAQVSKAESNIVTNISGISYSNNIAGATATTMYALDAKAGKLYKQDASSATALQEVGSLGVAFDMASLEIAPSGLQAVIIGKNGSSSSMYEVNLTDGKAILTGKFYDVSAESIAIPTNKVAYGMNGADFVVFDLTSYSYLTKASSGLQANETVIGMDIRPASGQMYAVGSTNKIYKVNMATGVFTAVANLSGTLNGQNFGMDFNPIADDSFSLVSNSGQNLSVTLSGSVTVNPAVSGTMTLSALAYNNNYANASTSTVYAISDNADALVSFVPATGITTFIGNLGVDVSAINGFDVYTLGTANQAIGVFNVAGKTNIYNINLSSGTATADGKELNISVNAFALGLRL